MITELMILFPFQNARCKHFNIATGAVKRGDGKGNWSSASVGRAGAHGRTRGSRGGRPARDAASGLRVRRARPRSRWKVAPERSWQRRASAFWKPWLQLPQCETRPGARDLG